MSDSVQENTAEDSKFSICNRDTLIGYICFKRIYQHSLILAAILVAYLLIGAWVFADLERASEIERNANISSSKDNYTQDLEDIIEMIVMSGSMNVEQATELIDNVTMAAVANSVEETANWEYGGSLFFTLTIVTTIGYGNTAPSTEAGQIFFIFYALVGIPITLAFLGLIGKVLKQFTDWVAEKILVQCHEAWKNVKLAAFILLGLISLVFVPAAIFTLIQDWSYFQSLYYCLVTLTTVGFGDLVPSLPSSDYDGAYRVAVACWIFMGLAYLLLVINEVQELFERLTDKLGKKCNGTDKKDADEDMELGDVDTHSNKGKDEEQT